MLTITIHAVEQYNENSEEFTSSSEQILQLEHSLVSISKWESKWKKAFLSKGEKTIDETLDYIRCMTLNKNVESKVYELLTNDNMNKIMKYIEDDMTATTFSNDKKSTNREIITAEIIYYWMIALNIPFECQKWHLNRLLTLVNVCNIKNAPPKKTNKKELMNRNTALNKARQQQLKE